MAASLVSYRRAHLGAAFVLGALCAAPLGCKGSMSAPLSPESAPEGPAEELPSVDEPGGDEQPGLLRAGTRPIRRLSRAEYNYTLQDVLGTTEAFGDAFATETIGPSGYREGAGMNRDELIDLLDELDRLVADQLAERWSRTLPCTRETTEPRQCALDFIDSMGAKLYRHPVPQEDVDALLALFEEATTEQQKDFAGAVGVLLKAMLLSPRFHYHWEVGEEALRPTPGGLVALTSYEIASRLSYLIWQSAPDEALREAAASGDLRDPDEVRRQAERMLDDPERGGRAFRGFVDGWLGLYNLEGDALREQMREATLLFAEDLVAGEGDARFETLLTAKYAFATEALAARYGLEGDLGEGYHRVEIGELGRAGILMQLGFLASSHSTPLATPMHRGRFLYERLAACRSLTLPPDFEIPELPPSDPALPVRRQLGDHAEEGACRSCHQFMDPLGFAFLGFDAEGAHRTTDGNGHPADTSGRIELAGAALEYDGAKGLVEQLARAESAQACFAQQYLRFALRTDLGADERPSLDALREDFARSGLNLRELIVAATQVPSFYYRRPRQTEALR